MLVTASVAAHLFCLVSVFQFRCAKHAICNTSMRALGEYRQTGYNDFLFSTICHSHHHHSTKSTKKKPFERNKQHNTNYITTQCTTFTCPLYRGADRSLARPGRIQANVSVRMAPISFGPCLEGKKLDDSSRLDVVEIASVPDILPRLFPSRSG